MPSYTQDDRPIKLTTTLGKDVLLLERFQGREAISEPFLFILRCVSTAKNLAIESLLHKGVTLEVKLANDDYRPIHGLVRSARMLEMDKGLVTYELEMTPWLWFLTQTTDCRIFQDKTVQQIITEVFEGHGYKDFRFSLSKSYDQRKYCVQYRETDFNFVSRLMEEEGISYYFEHTSSKHVLVLLDSPASVKPCPVQSTMKFAHEDMPDHPEDFVHTLDLERSCRTGKITIQDFDFIKPSTNLLTKVDGAYPQSEQYDYPGLYYDKGRGDKLAKTRLEVEEWPEKIVRGVSSARPFSAGYKFTLTEHFRSDMNAAWLLVAIQHKAEGTNFRSDLEEPFRYENQYEAIPAAVPFRPPYTHAKPAVKGTQTAIVVGPAGEEIWVDKYGRVKIHFHWDRLQPGDDKASCWVRVTQSWAGGAWGWMTIPRIGQEVVVSFQEGDPDRPLITGRVYNEAQQVPYKLPDHKTISTWRSRSSKGGGATNFNEIRMEDLKGSEQLFLHAEKDRDDRTKNDSREWVGKDRHLYVRTNQQEEVGGAKHLKVGGQQNEKIGGKYSLKVGSDFHTKAGMNYALEAGMEVHVKAGMKVIIEAGMQLSLKGPGGFVNIDPSGVQIQGTMVLINSGGSAGSGGGSSPEDPKEPDKADDGTKRGKL
ncbi:MAG: type VI secretion system tip protein VgrG [Bryobacteraceae bacterium]|nr:type VI secretion system tip protein VgrG [Bryobacteraceae bacterium]